MISLNEWIFSCSCSSLYYLWNGCFAYFIQNIPSFMVFIHISMINSNILRRNNKKKITRLNSLCIKTRPRNVTNKLLTKPIKLYRYFWTIDFYYLCCDGQRHQLSDFPFVYQRIKRTKANGTIVCFCYFYYFYYRRIINNFPCWLDLCPINRN